MTPTNESKAAGATAASVRSAMPAHIQQMGAEAGETLVWDLYKVKGRRIATITEAGGNKPEAAA